MVINTFSGRVQFTALSISFHFMRMTRVKFLKGPLGDVLKEVIEWEICEIRDLSKKSKYPKFVQNISRNRSPIIFWKAVIQTCSKIHPI